jgi:zinc D-Ala-D-Ala carboxypeptidase
MELKQKVSKYLTLAECVKSQTAERKGIRNMPDENQLAAMQYTGRKIFDPCREHVGGPLAATSFFRCPELNVAIGGTKTSDHPKGEAVDMDCDVFGNGTNKELFDFVRNNLEFDQLIWEYGDENNPAWVHASISRNAKENRKQVLRIYNDAKGKKVTVAFDLY